jgi:hypothetical protein
MRWWSCWSLKLALTENKPVHAKRNGTRRRARDFQLLWRGPVHVRRVIHITNVWRVSIFSLSNALATKRRRKHRLELGVLVWFFAVPVDANVILSGQWCPRTRERVKDRILPTKAFEFRLRERRFRFGLHRL